MGPARVIAVLSVIAIAASACGREHAQSEAAPAGRDAGSDGAAADGALDGGDAAGSGDAGSDARVDLGDGGEGPSVDLGSFFDASSGEDGGALDGAPDGGGEMDGAPDGGGEVDGGSGGLVECPRASDTPALCIYSCGDGVADVRHVDDPTCSTFPECSLRPRDAGPDGGCSFDFGEECDGTDLDGRSCRELGYAGGSLGCLASCAFDRSRCDVCSSDPRVTRCVRVDVDVSWPGPLALAATEEDIAIVWMGGMGLDRRSGLHFARLTPALEVAVERSCVLATTYETTLSEERHLALVPTASGWLAAIGGGYEPAYVVALDRDGTPLAPTREIADALGPRLVRGADGPPLLLWDTREGGGHVPYAAALADDGAELWRIRLVAAPGGWMGAAATDRGYLGVVGPLGEGAYGYAIAIDPDGTAAPPVRFEATAPAWWQRASSVVWDGAHARLAWPAADLRPGMPLLTFTPDGTLVATALASAFGLPGPAVHRAGSLLLVGDDRLGGASTRGVLMVGLAADGSVSVPALALSADPRPVWQESIALRGPDVVAAWVAADPPGRISLATVSP